MIQSILQINRMSFSPVVLKGEEDIGTITSGSWSPTKQQAIAFAYINTSHALINNEVQISIRGKKFKGVITKRAFYKKNY